MSTITSSIHSRDDVAVRFSTALWSEAGALWLINDEEVVGNPKMRRMYLTEFLTDGYNTDDDDDISTNFSTTYKRSSQWSGLEQLYAPFQILLCLHALVLRCIVAGRWHAQGRAFIVHVDTWATPGLTGPDTTGHHPPGRTKLLVFFKRPRSVIRWLVAALATRPLPSSLRSKKTQVKQNLQQ
jgi:hypothetical protein